MLFKKEKPRDYLVYAAKGFVMGSADVVPGVSGGTMALILGIYERLIHAIQTINHTTLKYFFTLKWKKFFAEVEWKFLSSLIAGTGIAIITLARPLEWLLENKPNLILAFFFGLILGSIFFLRHKVRKWNAKSYTSLVIGILVGFGIINITPAITPPDLLYVFFAGAIAIIAMILPGISGSFILVIIGKYQQVLSAVNNRDLVFIIVFLIGATIGLLSFARLLSWLLRKHYNVTMSILVGFMIGSVPKLWPWQLNGQNFIPGSYDNTILAVLGLSFLGLVTVLLLEGAGGKKKGMVSERESVKVK